MKELQLILKERERLRAENVGAVLATVVDVKGSGYRLPGAKMLIAEPGETFGTVSGGCLEADVLERARAILKTGAPQILTYDTRASDSVFSLNMGCNGVTRILLESARQRGDGDYFRFIENCFLARVRGVAATLIDANAEAKLKIGARFFFGGAAEKSDSQNFSAATFGGDFEIAENLSRDALALLNGGENSQCRIYEAAGGTTAEFFLEIISPPQKIIIFGAGCDAIPLADFAKDLGWTVSVVDHRAAFLTNERFPRADELVLTQPENLAEKVALDASTVAVLMTHNYEKDREILPVLLAANLAYVGALGPKKRTESLLEELESIGKKFTEKQLEKLFAPVGLDIGAKTPEAIALAVAAEIQAVLENRAGGFLRSRRGSIYERR